MLCYYQNINRIRSKLSDFVIAANTSVHDVQIFTETAWCEFCNGELGLNSYKVFRFHRSAYISSKKGGGGVMICMSNKYYAFELYSYRCDVEALFVVVHINQFFHLLICVVYIPSAQAISKYHSSCETFM